MARVTFAIWPFCVPLIVSAQAWLQSALFHHQFKIFSYGNFTQDAKRQLGVTKLKSFVLDGPVDCTFRCTGEPQCLSFNLAAHPDSDGLYQCDLLATDKYRAAAKDFQTNGAFHHYSPWVNIRTVFFFFFLFEGATGKEEVNSLCCELETYSLSPFVWKKLLINNANLSCKQSRLTCKKSCFKEIQSIVWPSNCSKFFSRKRLCNPITANVLVCEGKCS